MRQWIKAVNRREGGGPVRKEEGGYLLKINICHNKKAETEV